MTSTPRSAGGESLNESWVNVNDVSPNDNTSRLFGPSLLGRLEPYANSMERLLIEAQKESYQSSAIGSGFNSHSISPVSPASPMCPGYTNSPDAIFLSKEDLERNKQIGTDWIWDWSSRRPELCDLKEEWKFRSPANKPMSLREWLVQRGVFGKDFFSILVLTNFISLILGGSFSYFVLLRRTP